MSISSAEDEGGVDSRPEDENDAKDIKEFLCTVVSGYRCRCRSKCDP